MPRATLEKMGTGGCVRIRDRSLLWPCPYGDGRCSEETGRQMTSMRGEGVEAHDVDYARRLGQRLRAIREQRRWSLHDVEVASKSQFKGVVVDLAALEKATDQQLAGVRRYLGAVKLQRGDFNGRMLSIRSADVWAMAAMCSLPPAGLTRRLDHLGLLVRRP